MSKPERIGVYGGTFDPVHNAHLSIAHAALDHAKLDRVLFVVSARPPHKRRGPYASAEDRYAMVEAALAGEGRMEPSRLEMDRNDISYTDATLAELKRRYPVSELYLIIGLDSLVELPHWKNMPTILELSRLLVVPRPERRSIPAELEGHYELLPFDQTRLSSTEVRRRVAARQSIRTLVPPAVADVIREKGIYDAGSPGPARG
ncbi:MAG: nicotinate (nicotinamide) nucleotide adenylyltransferase [Candidatus Hydrogenedentes bacterium]|nr:nicotinate (nicotinamide) nucleotide adenylyltransferase [Candidatus Hydrogenedentota bacterium]